MKIKTSLVTIILFLGIFGLAQKSLAATYYASPSGSGNFCTFSVPCSLDTGISKLVAGDTLYLRFGTYSHEDWGRW